MSAWNPLSYFITVPTESENLKPEDYSSNRPNLGEIPIETPAKTFVDTDGLMLKWTRKGVGPGIATTILTKKNEVWESLC